MRIKFFEDFKKKFIKIEDVINCINNNGFLEADVVKGYSGKIERKIRPLSIDDDGEITVDIDSKTYYVDLEDVKNINW